jgi:Asp-tRNA(Asn)/Glu-tRNA(Gln) amidotransferase A subunit family amidase
MLELTALSAVAAMRTGDMKAEQYARALLDRAQRFEGLNAFRVLDRQAVLEAARQADRKRESGVPLGELHGLPIPVKDSVDTKDLPTSNGTRALRDFQPTNDAPVLRPLFAQGAILMGKTNLHELSYGWTSNNRAFGPVRNPYAQDRVPGGSSGGSGAAVAARFAPIAIAEDTLGSIRVPASMCGIVGFRPSHGRYPDAGIMPLSDNNFDQVGPLARSVSDLVLFDDVVTGDSRPMRPTPLSGVRIGVSADYFLNGLDPEVERIFLDSLRRLSEAGAILVWAEIPEAARSGLRIVRTIINFETRASIAAFLEEDRTGLTFEDVYRQASEHVREDLKSCLPPDRPSLEEFQAAVGDRQQAGQAIKRHFEEKGIAALALPPLLIPPPKIGDDGEIDIRGEKKPLVIAMARNVALGSCNNMASLVLPAGLTSNRLPMGIEFDALNGNDRELLALGLSLEGVLGPITAPPL